MYVYIYIYIYIYSATLEALVRPGRLDRIVLVGLPNREDAQTRAITQDRKTVKVTKKSLIGWCNNYFNNLHARSQGPLQLQPQL